MSETDRKRLMEQVLLGLGSFRSLRVQDLFAESMHRDVSLQQLHFLAALHHNSPSTVSALANLTGASLPSASSIVDRLEDRGYVLRTRDEGDCRVVSVALTDRGRAVLDEFVGLKREQMVRLMSAMTDEELTRFEDGMAALSNAADRLADSESAPVLAEQG